MRVRKMKRGKREVSQNIRERKRKRVRGWVMGFSGIGRSKLVRSQSRVLGMKTGRAVCRSQARDSTLPEKSSFSPPNLHSHLLPSPCIHHPIHHPFYSTA